MKKILVIDDDPEFIDAVTGTLESKGYEVISAENGKDGFNKAVKTKVDLILLDVMMSKQTEGFDIARKLKNDKATKDVPVIMITGIRKDMNLPFGFEPDNDWLPVKAVLEKPIKPDVLLNMIRSVIG